jgi:hypothetical protein
MLLSPAAFFAMLDVVRALFAKRKLTPDDVMARDEEKYRNFFILLMTDLFSSNPLIKDEKKRVRIIAELQALDPILFKTFIDNKLSSLETFKRS